MNNIPMSKRTPSSWYVDPNIQDAVNKKISSDPLSYKMAQKYGDFLLESRFALCDDFKMESRDEDGERIRVHDLVKNIKYYGLKLDDISPDEINLLKQYISASEFSELFP